MSPVYTPFNKGGLRGIWLIGSISDKIQILIQGVSKKGEWVVSLHTAQAADVTPLVDIAGIESLARTVADRLFVPSEVELLPWSPAPQQPGYSITDLKYRLIAHFGGVLAGEPVIVPDPVRREQARNAFATIQANDDEFHAILRKLGLSEVLSFTLAQQVLVFEEKKKLNAVRLEPTESGYSFWMMVREAGDPFEIEGTVGSDGVVNVLKKVHAILPR